MNDLIISLDEIDKFDKPCVLAVGMFDGLHLGHSQVIGRALEMAKKNSAVVGVLTFSPHPSKVVNMGRPPVKMLFNRSIRAKMFSEAGAKAVFVKKFDKRFAARTSASFEKFLAKKFPHLIGIVTGENFLFGKGAEGNADTLREMAARNGWIYKAVKGVYLSDKRRMSSSLLREALSGGDLWLFKRVSGRNYAAEGNVVGGKKLGRKLGFPTLNLPWNPDCKPPFGVYAVELTRGKTRYRGVANYGQNPTTGTESPVLESHLFKNVRFGEGAKIKVEFLKFLRPEKKFPSLDELKKQIAADKTAAQKFFAAKTDK